MWKRRSHLVPAGVAAGFALLGSLAASQLTETNLGGAETASLAGPMARPAEEAVPTPSPIAPASDWADADNPLLEPSATLVAPEQVARRLTDAEKAALAAELYRLQTRHATDLVAAIAAATLEGASILPPSLLLSIAYTETHGRVLAVSPAGAVGLAQATPAAFLMEGFEGPLFVTNHYLIGTRAFIMKKPLGDAVNIANRVIDGKSTHQEALALLQSAKELQRVGIEELEALEPVAPEIFIPRVRAAEAYNAETLAALERLLSRGASKAQLTSFRDRVRAEYRALLRVQQFNWQRYAAHLETERDRALRAHYRQDPVKVILERPYEAGELLGKELDARFSPSRMALFLASHLATKRQEAIALGIPEDELEAWTAALYNGGLTNITRMRAGLMTSIRETQNYMQKVPELRLRLDGASGQPSS